MAPVSPYPMYVCFRHTEQEAQFYCASCGNLRCKHCVKRFESVGLCPDCDALCTKVADLLAAPVVPERESTFEEDTRRLPVLAFARWRIFIAAWLGAATLAAIIGSTTEVMGSNSPGFLKLLVSSFAATGFIGNVLGYLLAGGVASGLMIRIADHLPVSKATHPKESFRHPLEPTVLFVTASVISLVPIFLHFGIPVAQSIAASMLGDRNYTKFLQFSIFKHIGTGCFLVWALALFPLTLAVGATKQNPLEVANPKTLVSAFLTLRELLIPAYVVTFGTHLVAGGFVFLIRHLPFGLIPAWLVITAAVFLSFASIGVSVRHAWSRLDPFN